MSVGIHLLPPELLLRIFGHLSLRDIVVNASLVCRTFNDAANAEMLWKEICKNKFGIILKQQEDKDRSAKTFYRLLLHKYGPAIGLWRREVVHYGTMHHLLYDGDWGFVMIQWFPPSQLLGSPVPYKCLTLKIDWDKEVEEIEIFEDFALLPDEVSSSEAASVSFICDLMRVSHRDLQDSLSSEEFVSSLLDRFSKRETGRENAQREDRIQDKFSHLIAEMMSPVTIFSRLQPEWPSSSPASAPPIPSGVFKGCYGYHGIEFVRLSFDGNDGFAATKLTGDPNVPAGEVTFRGFLHDAFCPMALETQMDPGALLEAATNPTGADWTGDSGGGGIFRFPPGWQRTPPSEELQRRTRAYRSRFACKCQVAGYAFLDPEFIHGHFVVFDDDLFAVIFIEIHSVSYFCRFRENLRAKSIGDVTTESVRIPKLN